MIRGIEASVWIEQVFTVIFIPALRFSYSEDYNATFEAHCECSKIRATPSSAPWAPEHTRRVVRRIGGTAPRCTRPVAELRSASVCTHVPSGDGGGATAHCMALCPQRVVRGLAHVLSLCPHIDAPRVPHPRALRRAS